MCSEYDNDADDDEEGKEGIWEERSDDRRGGLYERLVDRYEK